MSEELKDLINGLLRRDPSKRLGAKGWNEVKEHSFFKKANFDWEALAEKKMDSPLLSMIIVDPCEDGPKAQDLKLLGVDVPGAIEKSHYERWEWCSEGDNTIQ